VSTCGIAIRTAGGCAVCSNGLTICSAGRFRNDPRLFRRSQPGPPSAARHDAGQGPLNVWAGRAVDGSPRIISCFKLTAEDLAEIQRTGRVWLIVHGGAMPPVALTPFKPIEPA
jgi:hypothetical protein